MNFQEAPPPNSLPVGRISRRHLQLLVRTGILLLAIWLTSWAAYRYVHNTLPTAESVRLFLRSVKLRQLDSEARTKALRELSELVNALSPDERRQARMIEEWGDWYSLMSEAEKLAFVESTLPTGLRQMLAAFDKLPDHQRRRTVIESSRRLQEAKDQYTAGKRPVGLPPQVPNDSVVASPDLQQKLVSLGLAVYFEQTSAQSKAELAPLLEEIQRTMESGWLFRKSRPPRY